LPEYLAYRSEVAHLVDRVNERFASADYQPIELEVSDDFEGSVAALSCSDVLLVNPIRDGMNLVAKEGPVLNTADGVLALSREAGAFEELAGLALEINPFDVGGTATVLSQALRMGADERAAASKALRDLIVAKSPADWFNDQLAQADLIT
jgi:trehalose 6-phosphate synthase